MFVQFSVLNSLLGIKPNPVPFDIIRVGGSQDGAYLCPDDFSGISTCISPGVYQYKNFEDDLLYKYGIGSIMIDYSASEEQLSTPIVASKQLLIKKWLSPHDDQLNISIETIISQYCLSSSDDLILQIDIEGSEYENIPKWSDETLKRFRIIVIEFHSLDLLANPFNPKGIKIAKTIEKINKNHVCIHTHPNNCCGDFLIPNTPFRVPNVIECTYIRKDRITNRPGSKNPEHQSASLSHPLDIINVPEKPPLELDQIWALSNPEFIQVWRERKLFFYTKAFITNIKNLLQIFLRKQLKFFMNLAR